MFGTRRFRMGVLLGLTPVLPAVVWAAFFRAPADRGSMRLEVSIAAKTLKVIENGKVVKTYAVATGRPGNPTPRGSFRTGQIVWNPWWRPPNVWWARNKKPQAPGDPDNPIQGVKIFFRAPDYYIHGTNDPGSIGRAASRGCVRMRESDAKNLARRIRSAGGSVPLQISALTREQPGEPMASSA
jgi:lipoprotein-anchoring transpeptidase ErfK/SrfK